MFDHVILLLHVLVLVGGPGHVDAVQDRLPAAVPGEEGRRPAGGDMSRS